MVDDQSLQDSGSGEVSDTEGGPTSPETTAYPGIRAKLEELNLVATSPEPVDLGTESEEDDGPIQISDIDETVVETARSMGVSDEDLVQEFETDPEGASGRWIKYRDGHRNSAGSGEQPTASGETPEPNQPTAGLSPEQVYEALGIGSDEDFEATLESAGFEKDDPQAKLMRSQREQMKLLAGGYAQLAGTVSQASTASREQQFVSMADSYLNTLDHAEKVYGDKPWAESSGMAKQNRWSVIQKAAQLVKGSPDPQAVLNDPKKLREVFAEADSIVSRDHNNEVATQTVLRRGRKKTGTRSIDPSGTRQPSSLELGQDHKRPKTREMMQKLGLRTS